MVRVILHPRNKPVIVVPLERSIIYKILSIMEFLSRKKSKSVSCEIRLLTAHVDKIELNACIGTNFNKFVLR